MPRLGPIVRELGGTRRCSYDLRNQPHALVLLPPCTWVNMLLHSNWGHEAAGSLGPHRLLLVASTASTKVSPALCFRTPCSVTCMGTSKCILKAIYLKVLFLLVVFAKIRARTKTTQWIGILSGSMMGVQCSWVSSYESSRLCLKRIDMLCQSKGTVT